MDLFSVKASVSSIRELPRAVEIDTQPESEGMGNRFRRGITSGRGGLADAGANCSIHRFKGMPSSRARCFSSPARSSSSVRVLHISGIVCALVLVSRHQNAWALSAASDVPRNPDAHHPAAGAGPHRPAPSDRPSARLAARRALSGSELLLAPKTADDRP
jgi:hypothetical protein